MGEVFLSVHRSAHCMPPVAVMVMHDINSLLVIMYLLYSTVQLYELNYVQFSYYCTYTVLTQINYHTYRLIRSTVICPLTQ
jgi:hypothetical protein